MSRKLIRVAIYARFSCDKQRDASIEDQLYECNKYAERHGYTVVMQYCDYAMSGRSDDRPNFLRMIEDAKTGMFEIILVWKMDRFARNIEEQYYYEHVLRKNGGVTFESVKENIAGTSIEATSTKALNALFAEVRSRQSAEDTMRGMLGKARKCQYLGYPLYGYSHDGDKITLDPEKAPIAKRIHVDFLSGVAPKQILDWLLSIGVKTARGKDPGYGFVVSMLKNVRYAGVYMWGVKKDEAGNDVLDDLGRPVPLVYIEDGMPAIVSMSQKLSCIEKLGFRRRLKTNADYLLSGKLICSKCKEPMHGETAIGGSGIEYWRYSCRGKRKACLGSFNKETVEQGVVTGVREMLRDTALVDYLIDRHIQFRDERQSKATIEAVRKDIRAVKKQRDNLLSAVAEGLDFNHVKPKIAALDAQERALEKRIEELKREQNSVSREELRAFFSDMSKGALSDEQITLTFVSKVWLYESTAVAVMNFDSCESTQYEIELALKKHERPDQQAVRETSEWCPRRDSNARHPL